MNELYIQQLKTEEQRRQSPEHVLSSYRKWILGLSLTNVATIIAATIFILVLSTRKPEIIVEHEYIDSWPPSQEEPIAGSVLDNTSNTDSELLHDATLTTTPQLLVDATIADVADCWS